MEQPPATTVNFALVLVVYSNRVSPYCLFRLKDQSLFGAAPRLTGRQKRFRA